MACFKTRKDDDFYSLTAARKIVTFRNVQTMCAVTNIETATTIGIATNRRYVCY